MSRPPLEVADVIRAHGQEFIDAPGSRVTTAQHYVLKALAACRTSALGGHRDRCENCGRDSQAYNSCQNRHCPKCQGGASAQWFAARQEELLPVEYAHVVFTLPDAIARVALQNKKLIYNILFHAAAETLQTIAADPRHLGARIGFLAVLHTWGQNLLHHPHLHCVIPAGGVSPDGKTWISCPTGFFLHVKILSRVFRGKFLEKLRNAYRDHALSFHGRIAPLAHPSAFAVLLDKAYRQDWVVYARPPFGGPEQVLKYLARYTHRVAIANRRLLSLRDGSLCFRWKDYRHGNRNRTMRLSALEFLRRFLLHLLPKGFVRIRHFGFLAHRNRGQQLKLCRALLPKDSKDAPDNLHKHSPPATEAPPFDTRPHCVHCGSHKLVRLETWPRSRISELLRSRGFYDTS